MKNNFVRKADKNDIPRLKEIRFAVKENRLSDPTRVTDQDIEWFIENGPIWVYEIETIILGFSAGDPRDGSIWALFVHPNSEKQGTGKILLHHACESLWQVGHKTLTLGTDAGTRAAHFYKMLGWVEQGKNERGESVFVKHIS